jgi:hypothetical protein
MAIIHLLMSAAGFSPPPLPYKNVIVVKGARHRPGPDFARKPQMQLDCEP